VKRVIHEEAQAEFDVALDYYLSISPDLAVRFYREIERLMMEVCARPELFRQFDPPARRHFSDRFPYGVIYVLKPDHLWIVAVMPLHREPGYWKHRLG
jgi:plasmid stabilization system protein ParE